MNPPRVSPMSLMLKLTILMMILKLASSQAQDPKTRRNTQTKQSYHLIDTNHPSYGLLSVPLKVGPKQQPPPPSFVATRNNRRYLATGGAWSPVAAAQHQTATVQYLPRGPPPFKPSMLMVKLAAIPQLDRLNLPTKSKSKIYYLCLDILQQLALMVDKMSRRKMRLTDAKLEALRAVVTRLTWKGGHSLKLKWPLILMNPLFLKELFSSPTFLVMLFHAVELAYVSAPHKIWLRPFMKMIKQHGPEKEERIWWRRKRIYDTLYGPNASELEPNLKSIHFREPHPGAPFAVPAMVRLVRLLMPESTGNSQQETREPEPIKLPANSFPTLPSPDLIIPVRLHQHQQASNNHSPATEQLMSQEEFDGLDEAQRESLLQETRHRLEESRWTNALIKHQTELVESMLRPQQATEVVGSPES